MSTPSTTPEPRPAPVGATRNAGDPRRLRGGPLPVQGELPLEWRRNGIAAVADHPVPHSSTNVDRWVGRICAAVAEVAAGDRAAHQMVRIAAPSVLSRLTRQAHLGKHRSNSPISRVTSVRVSRPAQDTIEACAVVQGSVRCQAVAVQLRRRNTGWVLTAAEVR